MAKKILLIEDEPQMRRNLQLILERSGFEVCAAENGSSGIALAKTVQPDLILCDVMMPEVDGYGVLGALRAEPATEATPFIFLTAKGDRADIRAGMNLGADDYLTKPVSMADLLAAVTARLARTAEQRAELRPAFSSPEPLLALGLSAPEAELLFWIAQGKTNAESGTLLHATEAEVQERLDAIFEKLSVKNRAAATLCALEALAGGPRAVDEA